MSIDVYGRFDYGVAFYERARLTRLMKSHRCGLLFYQGHVFLFQEIGVESTSCRLSKTTFPPRR